MTQWDITEETIMKQLFKTFTMLLFVGVLFTNKLNAQMTLEHTFEDRVKTTMFGEYYFTGEFAEDDSYATLKIYNSDYSLKKEVTLYPLEGYSEIGTIGVLAPDLIMVESVYYDNDYHYHCCYCMYDSNGNIIKNWGADVSIDDDMLLNSGIIHQNKLMFWVYNRTTGDYYTEIYSIDGYESVKNVRATSFGHAYPNPARNTISLPYNLNKGEQAEMLIYDVNGKMIEKKTIDSTFDKILLNVESYTPGIYFYSVNGVSHKFVVR